MTKTLRAAYRSLSVRLASLTGSSFIIEHDHVEFSVAPKPRRSRAASVRTDRSHQHSHRKA